MYYLTVHLDADHPISTMFLSPGVTPWKTTLPGVKDGANNPGIRSFEYDTQTLLVQVRHPERSFVVTTSLKDILTDDSHATEHM